MMTPHFTFLFSLASKSERSIVANESETNFNL